MPGKSGKALEGKDFPVHLIIGADNQITRDTIRELIDGIVEPAFRELNTLRFDAAEEGICGTILGAMLSPPFWGRGKVILVTRFNQLDSASSDKLTSAISKMPKPNVLILWAEKMAETSKAMKAIREMGRVVELDSTNLAVVGRWAEAKARSFGALLAPDAKARLLEMIGPDPDRILREIEKLAAFVKLDTGEKKPGTITSREVEELTENSPEANVFKITEAIGARDAAGALSAAREAVRQGNTPIGIIALIGYQIRNMLLAKAMIIEEKKPIRELTGRLGKAGFRAQRYLAQSRNFTKEELICGLIGVSEADRAIKSGKIPEIYALEKLILELCRKDGTRRVLAPSSTSAGGETP